MYREIKKKKIILENRKPYDSQVGEYIWELDTVDWVYDSMRLDGSRMSRAVVERILKGGFVEDASLNDHVAVERYAELVREARDRLALECEISVDTIFSFQQKLTGKASAAYRRENPVLISLDYNPPHPSAIKEQMEILMNWFYTGEGEANPLMRAVLLHHRLIEIYPFDNGCEAIARAALYYDLMRNGYPPFALGLSEQEYNAAVIAYLKKEDAGPFYAAVERSLYNKMDLLIRLTAS